MLPQSFFGKTLKKLWYNIFSRLKKDRFIETFNSINLHPLMTESKINITVQLDTQKVPQQITWSASGSTAETPQKAKAMFVAFWDAIDKSAMRIDLWTKDMMVDEMADFYFQLFTTMADTFQRATKYDVLTNDIKTFAKDFHKKFIEIEKERKK